MTEETKSNVVPMKAAKKLGKKGAAPKKAAVVSMAKKKARRRLALSFSPVERRHRARFYDACSLTVMLAPLGLVDPIAMHALADAVLIEGAAREPKTTAKNSKTGRRVRVSTRSQMNPAERRHMSADEVVMGFLVARIVKGKTLPRQGLVEKVVKDAWDDAYAFAEEDERRRAAP